MGPTPRSGKILKIKKKKETRNIFNITRKIVKQIERLYNQCTTSLRNDDGWHS